MSENKYVYHGSHIPDLKVIKPHKSTHQQNWVYATSSKAVATIFLSNKHSDLYYYLGGNDEDNNLVLVERKKGMFKDIFNVSGSIYKLSSKNFLNGITGWSMEVVSNREEQVLEEEKITDVYEELIKFNDEGKIKLYLYPNRPSYIPLDNSDLIPKVIRWSKKGYKNKKDIQEAKEKYRESKKETKDYFFYDWINDD